MILIKIAIFYICAYQKIVCQAVRVPELSTLY